MFVFYNWPFPHVHFAKNVAYLPFNSWLSFQRLCRLLWGSAHRSRQITMPAPDHSVFYRRMPFLPPNQRCQSTGGRSKKKKNKKILGMLITFIRPLIRTNVHLQHEWPQTFARTIAANICVRVSVNTQAKISARTFVRVVRRNNSCQCKTALTAVKVIGQQTDVKLLDSQLRSQANRCMQSWLMTQNSWLHIQQYVSRRLMNTEVNVDKML